MAVPALLDDAEDDEDADGESPGAKSRKKVVPILGVSPHKKMDYIKVNLNQNLRNEQLNQALLEDPRLIENLLLEQGSGLQPSLALQQRLHNSSSPVRTAAGGFGARKSRKYEHAFDKLKQLRQAATEGDELQAGALPLHKLGKASRAAALQQHHSEQELQKRLLHEIKEAGGTGAEDSVNPADLRPETPNPWYQHQKRKLLLRYQKHLLEKEYERRRNTLSK